MHGKWVWWVLGGILIGALGAVVLLAAMNSLALPGGVGSADCAGFREAGCSPLSGEGEGQAAMQTLSFDYNLINVALMLIFFAPGVLGSVALVLRRKALKRRPQEFFEI